MKYRVILSPDAEAGTSSAFRWYQLANPDAAPLSLENERRNQSHSAVSQ